MPLRYSPGIFASSKIAGRLAIIGVSKVIVTPVSRGMVTLHNGKSSAAVIKCQYQRTNARAATVSARQTSFQNKRRSPSGRPHAADIQRPQFLSQCR